MHNPVVVIESQDSQDATDIAVAPTMPAELSAGVSMPCTQQYDPPPLQGQCDVNATLEQPLTPFLGEMPETQEQHDAAPSGSGADAAAIEELQRRMGDFTSKQLSECLKQMELPSPERAVVSFCATNEVSVGQVTLSDVESSEHGLLYWAHKGLDSKASAPLGQQFTRALRRMDKETRDMYLVFFDDIKETFRQHYNMKRKWDFVTERRVRTVERCKSDKQVGEYMNQVQLGNSYGGHQFEECRGDAQLYMDWCKEYGEPMISIDSVTKKPLYFRIRQIFEVSNRESWAAITETSVTENVWQSLAAECRAKRSYAFASGMGVLQMGGPVIPYNTRPPLLSAPPPFC